MHLCAVVARRYSRVSLPSSVSLNWFMPAFVKSSVGSPCGTRGELGTIRWPFRSKYFRKEARISLEVIAPIVGPQAAGLKTRRDDGRLRAQWSKTREDAVGLEA